MEWNRHPEIELRRYEFNLFLTREQKQFNGGDTDSSKNGHPYANEKQNKNCNLNLMLYTKFNSVQTMELNIRHKIIKLLEKKIGDCFWEWGQAKSSRLDNKCVIG